MAKTEKEYTVEERLKHLFDLQKKLSKVDSIRIERGELPLEVEDLEDEIARMNTRKANYNEEVDSLKQEMDAQQQALETAEKKIERYDSQINDVRNNREYDYLTKEIEFERLNIELAEKKMREAAAKIETLKESIAQTQELLDDHEHVLAQKKGELEEIIDEHKQEEEKLREEAKKLERKIEPRLLTAFKRIRKNARNGLGIVTVQRDACGGCFNRIPPQRQMEIKMRKKIIVCEYCGRILIDPDLAGIKEVKPKTDKKG